MSKFPKLNMVTICLFADAYADLMEQSYEWGVDGATVLYRAYDLLRALKPLIRAGGKLVVVMPDGSTKVVRIRWWEREDQSVS